MIKLITVFSKSPNANLAPWIVVLRLLKSILPGSPISGVMMSAAKAFTIAPNAAPITTPTAKSTTFPRKIKSRNSVATLIDNPFRKA